MNQLGLLPSGWKCPYSTRSELEREISALEVRASNMDPEDVRARTEELRECHMQMSGQATYRSHKERLDLLQRASMIARGKKLANVDSTGRFHPDPRTSVVDHLPTAIEERAEELLEAGERAFEAITPTTTTKILIGVGLGVAGLYFLNSILKTLKG